MEIDRKKIQEDAVEVVSVLKTGSETETLRMGETIGGLLKAGDIVLLLGELGSGKTWFTRGLCAGLGVGSGVRSPSFSLINNYPVLPAEIQGLSASSGMRISSVYHADLYRLESESDLHHWGVLDLLAENEAVVIVEWGERLEPYLKCGYLRIMVEKADESESVRLFHLSGSGGGVERCLQIAEKMATEWRR